MRVLLTTDTIGGVWTYSVELARALAAHGVETTLATMGAPLNEGQRRLADALELDVRESRYKLEWMDQPWQDVAAAGQWLLALERQIKPDIVHLNGYAHGALRFDAPRLVVAHSCVCTWWRAVHGCEAPAAWNAYREAVAAGLRGADLVLAPTWAMLEALEGCHGQLPRIGVVPNGRDPRRFAPGRKESIVFAAGRVWDEAKNIAALEAVAPNLAWPVHVAGDQRHPVTGKTPRLRTHGLGSLGPEDMADWLGRASIYAHPARYEPFGLGVLEAALAGCALVLGDLPSLREVWDDVALFVEPDDHAGLQAAIARLIDHPTARRDLARRACQRALQLTPQRMALGYVRAYRHLAVEPGVQPASLDPLAIETPAIPRRYAS